MGTVYMSNKVCSPDKVEMVTLTWSRRQIMMVFLQLSPPIWRACAPYLRNSVSSIWSFFKHSNCQFWYHHPKKYAYIHRYDMDMDIIIYIYRDTDTHIPFRHTYPAVAMSPAVPCRVWCCATALRAPKLSREPRRWARPNGRHASSWVGHWPRVVWLGLAKKQGWKWRWNTGWWFGSLLLWLSIYWEFHHPNWRSHIFQRGRYTTNQNMVKPSRNGIFNKMVEWLGRFGGAPILGNPQIGIYIYT